MVKCYAFDVDETLWLSGGPIQVQAICDLVNDGHIVGLCGNFAAVTSHEGWHQWFSFIGPMLMSKAEFLLQLKQYVVCEEVIMVGNIFGVSGTSRDSEAAELAGVRFIKESDFAAGAR